MEGDALMFNFWFIMVAILPGRKTVSNFFDIITNTQIATA